jgi:hypothetical protein
VWSKKEKYLNKKDYEELLGLSEKIGAILRTTIKEIKEKCQMPNVPQGLNFCYCAVFVLWYNLGKFKIF